MVADVDLIFWAWGESETQEWGHSAAYFVLCPSLPVASADVYLENTGVKCSRFVLRAFLNGTKKGTHDKRAFTFPCFNRRSN